MCARVRYAMDDLIRMILAFIACRNESLHLLKHSDAFIPPESGRGSLSVHSPAVVLSGLEWGFFYLHCCIFSKIALMSCVQGTNIDSSFCNR